MPRNAVAPAASTVTYPSDTEIEIVRTFNAPREIVWRAFTEPALLKRWSGIPGFPMTACEMDVRPGGKFRWSFEGPGVSFTTAGTIHRVEPPHLLVMESTAPDPTPEVRTTTFDEHNGRTTVTMRIKTATKEIRDELLASGQVEGMDVTFTQLDALLTEQR